MYVYISFGTLSGTFKNLGVLHLLHVNTNTHFADAGLASLAQSVRVGDLAANRVRTAS